VRIVFVYPSITDSGFNVNKEEILYNNVHPGLCFLSAVCKKEGFKDISLIDLRILSGWYEFSDRIRVLKPDVALITSMSPDYQYASKCISLIKEVDPRIKIVVGGMHPTVMPYEMVQNTEVDYVVVGEGEIVLPELLGKIERGEHIDKLIEGKRPNVDDVPFMDRELFDCLEMPYDFFLPLPFATILAGRGCGYNCKFCAPATKIMHGYRIRRRSVDNVIEELKHLEALYGIKSFMFWDDCFTENKKWVMEFCEKYTNERFKMPFVCQTRVDIICKNPDMMRLLRKTGLIMASIGFESGNDRVLKFISKGTTVEQNLMAARICNRLGIKMWAYNMFGFPTETNQEAFDTMSMIRRIKPYRSSAAFFTPHQGSFFYDYCKENDLSLVDSHDDFVRFPEVDKPKIKNIDYNFMRKMATMSKSPSLGVKVKMKAEKILYHKKNKPFKTKIKEEIDRNPQVNKMAVLRMAHKEGRI